MILPDIALETSLSSQGYTHIAGTDEAGRGPLAGPVTAGAVIIHKASQCVLSVRDSKLMTAKQRELAFFEICKRSSGFGIGIVSAEEIDAIGINEAVKKAMLIALQAIEKNFTIHLSYIIVDGAKTLPLQLYKSQRILHGGLYHYSISAGSILAKVTRDRLMKQAAKNYPEYGFDKHVGYGTLQHVKALTTYGPCDMHRKTFEPIKSMIMDL